MQLLWNVHVVYWYLLLFVYFFVFIVVAVCLAFCFVDSSQHQFSHHVALQGHLSAVMLPRIFHRVASTGTGSCSARASSGARSCARTQCWYGHREVTGFRANTASQIRFISTADYEKLHGESMADPLGFWGKQAEEVSWDTPFTEVLDSTEAPFFKWFPDGQINMCYNAVDVHVDNGRGDEVALVYDSPVSSTKQSFTFAELQEEVGKLAGERCRLVLCKPMSL